MSETSTGGRQGGRVLRSGFFASGDPTPKIWAPDAQQLVRPEQSTGSGAFVDMDHELHSERDAKDVPQVGASIPRLPSTTRYAFLPTPVYQRLGHNAITLDELQRKLNFELRWEDQSFREMGGKIVWYSNVYIGDVLRGTGQASKKGVARDQAAYHALLHLDTNYATGQL
ncbi:uncharacterized protein EI90DRAFT_1017367 [Cantharellus anzutake]|uniref:uncharacterized protein n=1 Tax=Cantharellus anzutake TaxID=1750568 RepID=UPI0019071378|nr:uncharacterized protein EI90DRAFT_1017367 [Cantharellus anzutake]KAF8331388.1 hypothetical protein EI90DRAFT_1017367 [Cantharellus anzutake]